MINQIISAASATVGEDFYAYTSYPSLIRPITESKVILYRVERVSDGSRYATRIVWATVASDIKATISCVTTISFQSRKVAASRSLNCAKPPPDLDDVQPEDIPEGSGKELVNSNRSGWLQPFKSEDEPFINWRPSGFIFSETLLETRTMGFSRSAAPSSADCTQAANLAALAYMSDELLSSC